MTYTDRCLGGAKFLVYGSSSAGCGGDGNSIIFSMFRWWHFVFSSTFFSTLSDEASKCHTKGWCMLMLTLLWSATGGRSYSDPRVRAACSFNGGGAGQLLSMPKKNHKNAGFQTECYWKVLLPFLKLLPCWSCAWSSFHHCTLCASAEHFSVRGVEWWQGQKARSGGARRAMCAMAMGVIPLRPLLCRFQYRFKCDRVTNPNPCRRLGEAILDLLKALRGLSFEAIPLLHISTENNLENVIPCASYLLCASILQFFQVQARFCEKVASGLLPYLEDSGLQTLPRHSQKEHRAKKNTRW